jgi:hypothetical protein
VFGKVMIRFLMLVGSLLGLVETYEDLETHTNEEELPREVVTDSDLVLQFLEDFSLQDNIDIQNSFE